MNWSRYPKHLRTLDQKLAAALIIIQTGEFQSTISHLQRQLMSEKGRVLTGTQILRKMYMSLRTTRSMRTFHSIQDLSNMKWLGDDYISRFRNLLYEILADVGPQMNDEAKCGHLLAYWEQSELMKPEAQDFNRMGDDDPTKNFQRMLDTMDRIVVEQEEKGNR